MVEPVSGGSVPSNVRQAIYTLLNNAAYVTTGLEDEIAIVQAWAQEVTALALSETSLSFDDDTPQTLTATVVPSGSTVTWSSSNESVAIVVDGVVTPVANGSCVITATAGNKTANCAVTVSGFVNLESISAVYTQSGTVYITDNIEDLTSDLVVTANYTGGATETIPSTDYTLSGGMLEVGTNTIVVTYENKTTTFNVTVSAKTLPTGYTIADYITNENTSGYSYISTGYTATGAGVKVKTRFKNTASTGSQQYVITSTQKDTTAAVGLGLGVISSDTKLAAFNGNTASKLLSDYGKEFGDVIEAEATYESSLVTLKAYGQTISADGTTRNYTQNPVMLFGLKNRTSTTVSLGFKGRIYYAQVWQGDTLVSDMVPCIRQSDSVAGFYDLVGGDFHTKSGYTFEAGYNS